jgi:flagellar biosynthetic protein FlhB
MSDQQQRTEKPTQRRLQKARREGRFPVSRDFIAGFQWTAFIGLLLSAGGQWLANGRQSSRFLIQRAFEADLTPESLISMARTAAMPHLGSAASAAFLLAAASFSAHLVVTQLGFSTERLMPDFKRLNPLSKLKELPKQNYSELLRAVLLLPVFAYIMYAVIKGNLDTYMTLPFMPVQAAIQEVARSYKDLFINSALVLVAYGCFDFFRQRRKWERELRMSKQQIKEEMKEVEGNPQMKMRIRRLQRDLARRRMMQEVPTATAIIVNPTHYAVAIRYHVDSMAAPKVVAKGRNYLALRIRQKATEHGIPIVENPPLAQALYKGADIGQEIPAQFYKAVAEILAYIYRIMNGKLPS